MAPYRNSRTGNRTTRTQIDHDVFEGLPVRHWRKKAINVNAAPEKENMDNASLRNLTWKELPLPRDAHLLSPMSQDLLRAARMPQAKKPTTPLLDDDKELGEDEDADGEVDTGFVAKRWAVLPKELEGPEPEFLAKRRKGLPSVHSGALGTINSTAPMRKTKIRKVDNEGNNSVWEVLVPEGQTVDGEVVEEETSPTQAPAPGTVVEGVGVVNAEGVVIAGDQGVPAINKRRPPPPKRKPKGPGRDRKKKVAFAGPDGIPTANGVDRPSYGANMTEAGKRTEGEQGPSNGDTDMGDDSLLKEGDEGSEEGSEEEDGEDGDREEGELSPSPSASSSPTRPPPPAIVETEPDLETALPSNVQAPSKMPTAAAKPTKPPTEPTAEPITGHVDERAKYAIHEMLDQPIEEMLDEPMDDILDQRMDEYALETTSISTNPTQNFAMLETATTFKPEATEDIPFDRVIENEPESNEVLEVPHTESIPASVLEATAAPMIEMSEENPTSIVEEPTADHVIETAVEPLTGSMAQADGEQKLEAVNVEIMVSPAAATEPATVAKLEPQTTPTAVTMIEAEDEPIVEVQEVPIVEPAAAPLVEGPSESAAEHAAEIVPQPELVPEPQVVTERAKEAVSAPNLVTERASEPVPEPTPERKFSFTRPTSSPKAPTPSPPTPIEPSFSSLQAPQAPYLSPKAPTMSPPTPIDRGISSSPDLPLSAQLPPQIDATEEAEPKVAPDMQHIPVADRISVEAAPQFKPKVNAQIPVEHDPSDGMAEPEIAKGSAGQEAAGEQLTYFSDGEEDLLGSLERSLGGRGSGS
ncbi:hypothetical protein N7G274_009408 [Stereocaulon virgatum]|uniref:Uncharacterized protein n=1 Tax=Stereocaulon virgatum TaxID=373712 RepID=A0ABR3ZX60_9LECA